MGTEFFAGLPTRNRPSWERFLSTLTYWDTDLRTAIQTGIFPFTEARLGQSLSAADTPIAVVARDRDAILVTGTVEDFPMREIGLLSVVR